MKAMIRPGNIPALSAGKAIEVLSNLYSNAIRSGVPLRQLPSVMLWGPPGIGKSGAVRQMADRIKAATGKQTVITDVRLLLFNPIDLRGIPTANEDKTLAIWLKPQIFQMDPSEEVINLLFLDEISAAPQSVQAAAYQITLDRVIGEHKLPENCIVLAAGNRVTDKSVAYKMPKALANRLLHLEIEDDFSSWKTWAIRAGIHPMVLGFLSFRQDCLMRFDGAAEELAFATPRSWEMVSKVLSCSGGDLEHVYPLVAGLVGTGTAIEFSSWAKVFEALPDMEDIFNGNEPPIPRGHDALYALVSAMTHYAGEHRAELWKIENSIAYGVRLPPDFAAVLLKDYMYIEEDYRRILMKMPAFSGWMAQKGKLINGAV